MSRRRFIQSLMGSTVTYLTSPTILANTSTQKIDSDSGAITEDIFDPFLTVAVTINEVSHYIFEKNEQLTIECELNNLSGGDRKNLTLDFFHEDKYENIKRDLVEGSHWVVSGDLMLLEEYMSIYDAKYRQLTGEEKKYLL